VPNPPLQPDRRLMNVAAVDCTGLNGSHPVNPLRWVEMFLVQPTPVGGSDKSFFVEIVGVGTGKFQVFGRKKAVLIR
jgi:hypothetical protein